MAGRKGRFAFTSASEAVLYQTAARINPFTTSALKKDAWAQVSEGMKAAGIHVAWETCRDKCVREADKLRSRFPTLDPASFEPDSRDFYLAQVALLKEEEADQTRRRKVAVPSKEPGAQATQAAPLIRVRKLSVTSLTQLAASNGMLPRANDTSRIAGWVARQATLIEDDATNNTLVPAFDPSMESTSIDSRYSGSSIVMEPAPQLTQLQVYEREHQARREKFLAEQHLLNARYLDRLEEAQRAGEMAPLPPPRLELPTAPPQQQTPRFLPRPIQQSQLQHLSLFPPQPRPHLTVPQVPSTQVSPDPSRFHLDNPSFFNLPPLSAYPPVSSYLSSPAATHAGLHQPLPSPMVPPSSGGVLGSPAVGLNASFASSRLGHSWRNWQTSMGATEAPTTAAPALGFQAPSGLAAAAGSSMTDFSRDFLERVQYHIDQQLKLQDQIRMAISQPTALEKLAESETRLESLAKQMGEVTDRPQPVSGALTASEAVKAGETLLASPAVQASIQRQFALVRQFLTELRACLSHVPVPVQNERATEALSYVERLNETVSKYTAEVLGAQSLVTSPGYEQTFAPAASSGLPSTAPARVKQEPGQQQQQQRQSAGPQAIATRLDHQILEATRTFSAAATPGATPGATPRASRAPSTSAEPQQPPSHL
eukprot:m.819416 g.819416  ORF g.819416 m.819416 type:complete len:655 (-) comp59391_c0_seq4:301-2265(-)